MIPDEIKQKIDELDEDEIISKYDDEVLNWVDSDWQEDGEFENEYEWYSDFGKGEAEGVVVVELIKEYWPECTNDEYCELYEYIKEKFDCLRGAF